jgi:hypothetical protein
VTQLAHNFAVVAIGEDDIARMVDWSYRSPEEAAAAWTELLSKTIEA